MAEKKTTKPTEAKAEEKKPVAKKTTVRAAEKKSAAAKVEPQKVETKKAAPKTAAKEAVASTPVKTTTAKKVEAKPVAKKAAPKKPAVKKTAAKAAAKPKTVAATAPKAQASSVIAPEKVVSEYYVVRTIQRMAGSAGALLGDYNENMKRILESGRDIVEDMGKGTAEIIGNFVDTEKIKGRVSDLAQRTGVEKAGATAAAKTQDFVSRTIRRVSDQTMTTVSEYNVGLKKALETGMDMFQDMGSVTRTAVSGIAERGRKAASQVPMLGALESGLSSRMNLPSKKDLVKLTENAKGALKSKLPKSLQK
ncbi:MAG: hypothetical protein KKA60_14840 [Proteobacteria bacterium]|nr:hypothetical protein [Pseudomonadota bacterium]